MDRIIEVISSAAMLVPVIFFAGLMFAAYTSYAQPGYKAAKIHSA